MKKTGIVLLIFAMVFCCTEVGASAKRMGYTLLDSYSLLKNGQVAAIGTVVSVKNIDTVMHGEIGRILPEILIKIEKPLFGGDFTELKVIGYNTYYFDSTEWIIRVVGEAPWILPGDRVVFTAHELNLNEKGVGVRQSYKLRSVSFLLGPELNGDAPLYKYLGGRANVDLAGTSDNLTLDIILGSTMREAVRDSYMLSDIIEAIPRGGEK